MKLGMSERDARDRARDALLRACTDSLGLTTPPLPAPRVCPRSSCGKELIPGVEMKFCCHCGGAL